ncbi:FliI/YscN family ATPase [Loktanella sp. IMCC34160]|uniref:FliI/YscN family ATPase n=1 Tax=Loktanella sp. IMCC34160 TaxID=2510646 RepID=UPI00101D895B|nr:FliI/YscN family ATPase [Loktanella sp. IMCC34160]RYG91476.1 FliI/YscN family ATPase [Loktanella sp. IMCC34160]
MKTDILERARAAMSAVPTAWPVGRVVGVFAGTVQVAGLPADVRLGDRGYVVAKDGDHAAEVVRLQDGHAILLTEGAPEGVSIGDRFRLERGARFAPDQSWIGRVIDPDGKPLDGRPLLPGVEPRHVRAAPPPSYDRRRLGARMETGLAVFNTLLPLARGQRLGLFAGSGVGKSTLLADFARGVGADVAVIALVGERGREVREFVDEVLGPEGMARSVVVAATSDRAPQVRFRCALAATAVAEHFRGEGKQVLLLVDSITRFAEAQRQLAVAAGEPVALRGYPASTGPAIAALCERAGPGAGTDGDITAIYSVLVAGSDMEEPVADMLRGVLDGHIVLDRQIAERGRFPAVDLLRSVSRSLPAVATASENAAIAETRMLLGAYDRAELMIQSGLYAAGSDRRVDRAIEVHPSLERFLAMREIRDITSSFKALQAILGEKTSTRMS